MDVIAVVTGASRGAGKGIATALGETGATVYLTGRSTVDGDSPYGGTVTETADLITRAGAGVLPSPLITPMTKPSRRYLPA
jgi:NAD(P)-dependent dehydrogenase (short-subunit alcohol dehydrogenase family)